MPDPETEEVASQREGKKRWTEFQPSDMADTHLPHDDIYGPLTMEGQECPWPWEPPQLKGAPLGQYHCPYCGEMVIAGIDHIDYAAHQE